MYAIKENGELRAVSEDTVLDADETLCADIPQWVYDGFLATEQCFQMVAVENLWRDQEVETISNQLMALEEQEATGEEAGAMPGTRVQWLSYRTKVRAWKEGAENFPDSSHRPPRPE